MNYTDFSVRLYTATIGDLPAGTTSIGDAGFNALLPACIDYAEQRLYRELNLAVNSVRDTSFSLTANSRNLVMPAGTWVTLQKFSVITPVGTAADSGTRTPLTFAHWDYLDAVYGALGTPGLPQYWALQDAATVVVGPWPDQAYGLEIIGTKRPAPLSAANTATTLSLYFPDLFFCAGMIFMAGARLRNYGAQADDPQQGVTWESQYAALLASAQTEEARKKIAAA